MAHPDQLGPDQLGPESQEGETEYTLRKYLLMLATVVASATCAVGFNPPGGAWQDTDAAAGHLPGDPIIQTTNYVRYLVFFYCNATAFASSVLVIVLFLLLSIQIVEKKEDVWIRIKPLRVVMVLDLLSFMGAYAAGSCRDTLTTIYTSVLMAAAVLTYLAVQMLSVRRHERYGEVKVEQRLRKVLMLLATFTVSATYAAGLNSPGGFWDHSEGGHRAGDAILKDHHNARLTAFFVCNSTAFIASLLILMLLLSRKLHNWTVRSGEMYMCILVTLFGLVGAYASGSCRKAGATAYVLLLVAASLVCLILGPCLWQCRDDGSQPSAVVNEWMQQSGSLLLLLSTFATAITYQAGLHPPGGVWQDNGDGHLAGDPILLTTNASRHRTFFYCNSVAFVSSLVIVILFRLKIFLRLHVVEAVMMLELFGLIGAYAAGACRDLSTSIHVMALAGAVLLYVVIHVIFFTPDNEGIDYVERLEMKKERKLLYLLATMSTAMTYQAGLTPPGGFWVQDNEYRHRAGDPVLFYNHPGRYKAFFYCNSVSFMLSITIMVLLISPKLFRPAIRSYALTLCTVAGLCGLMGAYAAGSTQHRTTSIGIFVLVALAFLILVAVLLKFLVADKRRTSEMFAARACSMVPDHYLTEKTLNAQRKSLMLLGILVAGVTYQAGLDSPGGVWQIDGHDVGSPTMQDNRRQRYLAFFYANCTSFAASIVTILLLQWLKRNEQLYISVMHRIVSLGLFALLVAYAAGSSMDWKTSVYVAALIAAVLAYVTAHVALSFLCSHVRKKDARRQQQGNGGTPGDP